MHARCGKRVIRGSTQYSVRGLCSCPNHFATFVFETIKALLRCREITLEDSVEDGRARYPGRLGNVCGFFVLGVMLFQDHGCVATNFLSLEQSAQSN